MEAGSSKARRAWGMLLVGLVALLAALTFVASSPGASSSPSPSASSSISGSASPSASSSASTPAAPSVPASGSPGAATYTSTCSFCHGPQGEGVAKDGPSLKAAAFPEMIAQKVTVGGGGMPAFGGKLPAAQIQEVATYVAQQLADPTARQAQLGEGGEWYRLNCAGCHGATGRGGELSSAPNAPSFAGMPAANALAGMEIGPRSMPSFASTLNERQKAAISLYVQMLVSPEHPGGNGLGFIGPVVEGGVAWFFFVVLIVIAVWLAWGKGKGERA